MTPTPSTGGDARADLLERLKAATGPDRALDALITVVLSPGAELGDKDGMECETGVYWSPIRGGFTARASDRLTSSLDAALALVERTLPGWYVLLDTRGVHARISEDKGLFYTGASFAALATTAPLAILIALLSALPADSLGQKETGK